MKERSKEKMAEFLMEELLEQLREKESIKRKLGDMTALPVEELIEQLLDEFERVVERRRVQSIEESKARKEKRSKALEAPVPSEVKEAHTDLPTSVAPFSNDVPPSRTSPSEKAFRNEKKTEEEAVEKSAISSRDIGTATDKLTIEFPPIPLYIPSLDDHPIDAGLKKTPERISQPEKPQPASVTSKPVETHKHIETLFDRKREEEKRIGREESKAPETVPQTERRRDDVSTASGSERTVEADQDLDDWDQTEEEEETDNHESDIAATKLTTMPKLPYQFADNDYVYVHAVAGIPTEETASDRPYMLEEKGIDDRDFAFALDYKGLRFYLSKFNPENMSVSKTGVLLLGKQETLQLQGVHESILNDLRIHSVLLPFKFGTVSRGKDHLLGLIDDHLDDLRQALSEIAATKWWTLCASVLDSRIAQLVGPQPPTRGREREQHRASYSQPALAKKYDVKTLERMLQKEKKLAESVHEEMKKYAERSDIDMMVSLGSGSSEDWKTILKASYEVSGRSLRHFNRAVTDLQYHHIMFDIMLSLTGDKECFSFD